MTTIVSFALCLFIVAAILWRLISNRPLSEIIIDWLYASAMRSTARAVAADRALVAYRKEMAALKAGHTPKYAEVEG